MEKFIWAERVRSCLSYDARINHILTYAIVIKRAFTLILAITFILVANGKGIAWASLIFFLLEDTIVWAKLGIVAYEILITLTPFSLVLILNDTKYTFLMIGENHKTAGKCKS